jgi:hypothetical protein
VDLHFEQVAQSISGTIRRLQVPVEEHLEKHNEHQTVLSFYHLFHHILRLGARQLV